MASDFRNGMLPGRLSLRKSSLPVSPHRPSVPELARARPECRSRRLALVAAATGAARAARGGGKQHCSPPPPPPAVVAQLSTKGEGERARGARLPPRSLSDTGWVRARCLGLLFSDDID